MNRRDLFASARIVLLFCVTAPLGGCAACFAEQIAPGVAKLSVLHAGAIAMAVREDTRCGFASSRATTQVTGEVGEIGVATTRVEGCRLSFVDEQVIATDCLGATTSALGVVLVDAEQTVRGYVTGDPNQPVIPLDARSAALKIVADLEDFSATQSSDPASMKVQGELRAEIQIELAKGESSGACTVATNNIGIGQLELRDAKITLKSGRGDPTVNTNNVGARLDAVIGLLDDEENSVQGTVRIFGNDHLIDEDLFEDYDRTGHEAAILCDGDLVYPVTTECAPPIEALASGVARLGTALVGKLSALAAKRCFTQEALLELDEETNVGIVGQARRSLRSACRLDFMNEPMGSLDCNAEASIAEGSVFITGSQTITGRTTGDALRPAIPDDTSSVVMALSFEFSEDFTFTVSDDAPALTVGASTIDAFVRPKMALEVASGLCIAATPNAHVVWSSPSLPFALNVDGLSLGGAAEVSVDAQNGRGPLRENDIEAQVRLGHDDYAIRGDFIEGYDSQEFVAAYACDTTLREVDNADCDFEESLAADVARVLIASAGNAAALLSDPVVCADADGISLGDIEVNGCTLAGYEDWDQFERDFDECAFRSAEAREVSSSCDGSFMTAQGSLRAQANDAVRARICTDIENPRDFLNFIDDPFPTAPDVSRVLADQVELTRFRTIRYRPDQSVEFEATVDGLLSLDVVPVMAERRSEPGRFDIQTPVVRLNRVAFESTMLELMVDGLMFRYALDAELSAMIGAFAGDANRLQGSVHLDGRRYEIDTLFDDTFDPATVADSYLCDPDVSGPLE